jgi:hypothetical protein
MPAEEKRKPTKEKRHQHSIRFQPSVEGADIPDGYEFFKLAEQSVWWAIKTSTKVDKLEAQTASKVGKLEA